MSRNFLDLVEGYANEIGWLHDYLHHGSGDFKAGSLHAQRVPWDLWHELVQVLSDVYESPSSVFREVPEDVTWDTFEDYEYGKGPELWSNNKLSAKEQEMALRDTWDHHNPNADSPSYFFLERLRLLKNNTWLIRFSNHSEDEWINGFRYGQKDMERIGLTTWMGKPKGPGYNFAFVAGTNQSFKGLKYGTGAVMFQSAGVEAYHNGDNEDQVIFWGPSVGPQTRVHIYRPSPYEASGWVVDAKNDKGYVFKGDLGACQEWVMRNFQQYRRLITYGS